MARMKGDTNFRPQLWDPNKAFSHSFTWKQQIEQMANSHQLNIKHKLFFAFCQEQQKQFSVMEVLSCQYDEMGVGGEVPEKDGASG